jgi:hypothetical protein
MGNWGVRPDALGLGYSDTQRLGSRRAGPGHFRSVVRVHPAVPAKSMTYLKTAAVKENRRVRTVSAIAMRDEQSEGTDCYVQVSSLHVPKEERDVNRAR